MKRIILFIIITFTFILSIFGIGAHVNKVLSYENNEKIIKAMKEKEISKIKLYNDNYSGVDNYYKIYHEWKNQQIPDSSDQFTITAIDVNGGELYDEANSYDYGSEVVYLAPLDTITFNINVQEAGLFQLYFDYYVLNQTRLTPNISLFVNGDIQYTEMYNLDLLVDWEIEDGKHYDRYGDEMTPKSEINQAWMIEQGLYDPNYFFTEPMKVNLNEGNNEIKITLNEGYILLGTIKVMNQVVEMPTYETYLASNNEDSKNINKIISLEAEDYQYKNRRGITAKYKRDPSVTPYKYKNRVLNVLSGDTFSTSGDRVTYDFKIEEAGFYKIALKYYHNSNNGIPSHRRILIDGKVPFQEMEYYQFDYQTNWKNEVLKDTSGNPYVYYLSEGVHTLMLGIDNVKVAAIYHDLLDILDEINSVSLDVHKITGGLIDRDRNWKITTYINDLVLRLSIISDNLDQTIDNLILYTGNKDLPIISELKISRDIIQNFIENPEDLPGYMDRFSDGDSSAYARINTILPKLLSNPLNLDKIYIYNNVDLPKANVNIFHSMFEGIKAFVYSFFDPKYNEMDKVDDDTIEIWVNKSRLYVEIMQRMIDEEFTPQTGVKVQLSIMPDENKIILSNAAGTTPDGIIGISVNKPFEFALRGIAEDLRKYDGFYDLANEFNPNTFIPYIYEDGVYAMPETQDVNLLFYRKDILNQLGLEPPQTWEDVVTMLPVLQKYNMNFYSPIGNKSSYKGFGQLTPLIYQSGGQLYDNEAMTTVVNQGGAYDAFEFITDLFTVYNMPVQTSNFFQHFRTGKIPVGIAGAGTYIQLKYAAPELAGQWGILPIPGIQNSDGVIKRWDPTYGSSSIIFSDNDKKAMTWKLIKWWCSSQIQSDFSYEIQSTLGDKFLYMTANMEGFKDSAWPRDSKDIILEQWQWIQATGKVPGDYMLERELSNAWNSVVLDGINSRIAIDQITLTVNNELHRKLKEFGYMDDGGNIIKPYIIPTIYNVESWVRKDE